MEYLSVLESMAFIGRGMADIAERTAEVLTASVSMGRMAIVLGAREERSQP